MWFAGVFVIILAGLLSPSLKAATLRVSSPAELAAAPAQEKKEYLTDAEAAKIRDADTANERVKLYISFADDRLKKFQYELGRTSSEMHRGDTLNGLLNGYSGSMDDAADVIQGAIEKDADILAGLKEMTSKGKEFLAALQKIDDAKGKDFESYKDTLEDAIEGTMDAVDEAQTAEKTYSAPVRRKQ